MGRWVDRGGVRGSVRGENDSLGSMEHAQRKVTLHGDGHRTQERPLAKEKAQVGVIGTEGFGRHNGERFGARSGGDEVEERPREGMDATVGVDVEGEEDVLARVGLGAVLAVLIRDGDVPNDLWFVDVGPSDLAELSTGVRNRVVDQHGHE